ncbi:serine/threonine-protein kinase HAL4/sat4 [Thoreauomyces humboldtii]|nr:serine/threonine-protein kinase HAL4/sat4 [Thoreauomyces humboldtii]
MVATTMRPTVPLTRSHTDFAAPAAERPAIATGGRCAPASVNGTLPSPPLPQPTAPRRHGFRMTSPVLRPISMERGGSTSSCDSDNGRTSPSETSRRPVSFSELLGPLKNFLKKNPGSTSSAASSAAGSAAGMLSRTNSDTKLQAPTIASAMHQEPTGLILEAALDPSAVGPITASPAVAVLAAIPAAAIPAPRPAVPLRATTTPVGPNGQTSCTLKQKYGKPCQLLGKGANGNCFLVRRPTDDKVFAVKEFRRKRENESQREYMKKLTNEYCIGTLLHHPNVVETLDIIFEKGHAYEVMELCEGGDLFEAIASGKITQDEANCLLVQMMKAVSYLHSTGVCHRDLKPENILFDTSNHLKIIDFGSADVVKSPFETNCRKSSGRCGSGPYMAPEEFSQKSYDGRKVDVWACGIVYLAMIFQRFPWTQATPADCHWSSYLSSGCKTKFFDRLPEGPRRVLRSMLEPDPDRRATMEECLEDPWVKRIAVCDGCVTRHHHGGLGGIAPPFDALLLHRDDSFGFGGLGGKEEEIPSLPPPTLRSPLYSADAMMFLYPHLIDAIAGSLPSDAWEWASTEVAAPVVAVKEKDEERKVPPPPETVESSLQKDGRGYVVWNLVETERNYYAQLGILQNFFKQRLVDQGVLSETAANLIFAGIDDLHAFHKKFNAELEKLVAVGTWKSDESRIGALFISFKDDLVRLYTRFIDNYAMSQKLMKREERENADYQSFMKEAVKLRETGRQQLKDFMILPVQRTARYHLLLKDLKKRTADTHPDSTDLQSAWEAMSSLASSVNEKKRKEEEATGLFEAFEQTKNCPPTLIRHTRKLIHNVDVVDHHRLSKTLHLFLCSDLLMVTQPIAKGVLAFGRDKGQEHLYKFVRWLDLVEIEVESLGKQGEAFKDSLRITYDATRRDATDSFTQPVEPASFSMVVRFEGHDATKNRKDFLMAVQSEVKKNRESRRGAK